MTGGDSAEPLSPVDAMSVLESWLGGKDDTTVDPRPDLGPIYFSLRLGRWN